MMDLLKELRERTGAGFLDCKKALEATNNNLEEAIDFLRKKGLAAAAKKQSRIASEGVVSSYIHQGSRIGVLIEVNCETDFVAKSEIFLQFAKDICLHIVASNPSFIYETEVDEAFIEREKNVYTDQLRTAGKPENMIPSIVEGRMKKLFNEVCLLNQPFLKNGEITVQDLLNELSLKLGEKIVIRRFVKFNLGEGLEKKKDNFAEEVSKISQK